MSPPSIPCLRALTLFLAASIFAHAGIVIDEAPPGKAQPTPVAVEGVVVPPPEGSPTPPAPASPGDTLVFQNRDLIHGKLVSIDRENGVRWETPEAAEPITFKKRNLGEIRLDRGGDLPAAKSSFSVTLTNGDELIADIAGLDADNLLLDTWYAGRLTIPRRMITGLRPMRTSLAAIYAGPTGLTGWKIGNESPTGWKYTDNAFTTRAAGSIGHDFKLPDTCAIDWEMSWRGYLQLMISVCSDNIDNYAGNCYNIQINQGSVYLQKMKRNGGSNNLGNAQVQDMQQHTKARIGLRINKEAKTVALLVDGQLVKQWTDRAEWGGGGGGLVFYSQGQSFLRLTDLQITAWDGRFEELGKPGERPKEDVITLENRDKVSGKLQSIHGDEATFQSAFAALKIPIARIAEVALTGEGADTAKLNDGDVRLQFAGRGSVTVTLEKWDEHGAAASSVNFGKATFDVKAFKRLQFNLGTAPSGDDPNDDGDDNGEGGGRREGGNIIDLTRTPHQLSPPWGNPLHGGGGVLQGAVLQGSVPYGVRVTY